MIQLLKYYYLLVVFSYSYLIKLSIGFPVRSLLAASLFVLLVLHNFRYLIDFLNRHFFTFLLFCSIGTIGVILSTLSGRAISTIGEELFANVGQQFLILFSTIYISRLAGVKFAAYAFLWASALSGGVALLQWVDFGPAWALYDKLYELQNVPYGIRNSPDFIGRPRGLSLHPVVFSYQVVVAYMLANYLYLNGEMKQRVYFIAAGLLMAAALACETRSAVLGIAVHEVLMILRRPNRWSLLWLGALGLAGTAALVILASNDSRLVSLDDTSAAGRLVLYNFGLRLSVDNPFGFGWGTEPSDLAWLYWEHLSSFVNAEGVYRLGIHNAFINFFLNYGLLGVAAFILCTVQRMKKLWGISLASTAYIVHGFFHNGGVFLGEYYFFFFLGTFYFLTDAKGTYSR